MTSRLATRFFLACAALSAFGAASFAHAAVYTVGSDGACTHTGIESAAAAADAHPGADEIHVVGTSNNLGSPDYTNQAIAFSVSANEQLDIIGGFADCSQAASTGTRTIFDGAGGATQPVFRITVATGGLVRMTYLTIQHGDEDGSGKGGGIYFKGDGILELNHAVLTRNTAGYGGGAIYIVDNNNLAAVKITRSVFNGNLTPKGGGGAIFNNNSDSPLLIRDSSFQGNLAGTPVSDAQPGGAILNFRTIAISNTLFMNNGASNNGGALANGDAGATQGTPQRSVIHSTSAAEKRMSSFSSTSRRFTCSGHFS